MVAMRRKTLGSVMVTGRLSFPALAKPEQFNGDGKDRYAVHLLIPKNGPEHKLIMEVANELLKDKLAVYNPDGSVKNKAAFDATVRNIFADPKSCCIKDGNTKAYDGYADNMVVSAYNNLPSPRPLCLDQAKEKITDPQRISEVFYSGCYVHAIINLWVQDNKNGKALRASCGGVMFYKNGDRFSGAAVAQESDFEEVEALTEGDPFDDKPMF